MKVLAACGDAEWLGGAAGGAAGGYKSNIGAANYNTIHTFILQKVSPTFYLYKNWKW